MTAAELAKHVQAEIAKDPKLVHPNFGWCLQQVNRHMSYAVSCGATTDEKLMAKLVELIKPLARKPGV